MKSYIIVGKIFDPDNRKSGEIIDEIISLVAKQGRFLLMEATACRDDEVAIMTNRTPVDEWPKKDVPPEWGKLKKE